MSTRFPHLLPLFIHPFFSYEGTYRQVANCCDDGLEYLYGDQITLPTQALLIKPNIKVPINPKLLFCLNKYMYNSEQNGAKIFDLGQNRNFL